MTTIEHSTHVRAGRIARAFAVFLALHGIAHLVGTTDSLGRASDGKTADYLGGLWKVSNPTLLRVLGVAWAIGAAGFLVTAWAFWMRTSWRLPALAAATRNSLALTVVGLWASVIGVAIDVVLLGVVLWLRARRDEVPVGGADPSSRRR